MGLIARCLDFVRASRNNANLSDLKCNPGGGANITCEHFAPAGDDSFPLKSDYAAIMSAPQSGSGVVVGYADPISTPKAQEGDKRIYSRDAAGELKAEAWLKNDGTIVLNNLTGVITMNPDGTTSITNPSGSIVLSASGVITMNGLVTIDTDGNITTPGSITGGTVVESASNVDLGSHTHGGVQGGPSNTAGPNPGP